VIDVSQFEVSCGLILIWYWL